MTGIEEATYSDFQAHIITRFSDVWPFVPKDENEGRRVGKRKSKRKVPNPRISESQRYAEKLRDPKKTLENKINKKNQLEENQISKREREREREIN